MRELIAWLNDIASGIGEVNLNQTMLTSYTPILWQGRKRACALSWFRDWSWQVGNLKLKHVDHNKQGKFLGMITHVLRGFLLVVYKLNVLCNDSYP